LRADSGFCSDLLLSWWDRNNVKYVVGFASNERMLAARAKLMRQAEGEFTRTGKKQRLFAGFDYTALTWSRVRWVIAKAAHTDKGSNPRFVITNIVCDAQKIHDRRYCARGEMENRVKEQMMLCADRVSTHRWWANQWRLLLSGLAYTLIETLRRLALAGTELPEATCDAIRLKLIKFGNVVVHKLTTVRLRFSLHHPLQDILRQAARYLCPL
jgi:hypothetical protein